MSDPIRIPIIANGGDEPYAELSANHLTQILAPVMERIAALEAEVDELRALERHVIESAIDDAQRNGTRPIDQLWEDVNDG